MTEFKEEKGIEIVLLWYVNRPPRDYDQTFICPFCRSTSEKCYNYFYSNLQFSDYVKEPMLWCTSCGARAFLDIDLKEFDNFIDNPKSIGNNCVPLTSDINAYKFPLKKVRLVRPNNFDYTSNVRLSDQQVRELCELNYFEYERLSEEVIKKYDLRRITEDEDEDENNRQHMNLALTCDSYDVMNPLVPYPKNADFSHDGVYLHCEVEDKEGKVKTTCFWGD